LIFMVPSLLHLIDGARRTKTVHPFPEV